MNTKPNVNEPLPASNLFGGLRFHAFHFNWLCNWELMFVIGAAGGRVNGTPESRWLYSLRVFLGVCKIEVLWRTGLPNVLRSNGEEKGSQ